MSAQNSQTSTRSTDQYSAIPDPNKLEEIREQVAELIEHATGQRQVILAHTLIVDFFDRDHNAAILFNQILYWTHRTNDPQGWFYKTYQQWFEELRFSSYQVWRVVRGDPRVQKDKRTLWSLGLETEVRMAPNGRNAIYYRLNIPAFMTAFTEWLMENYGLQVKKTPPPAVKTPRIKTKSESHPSIFEHYKDQLGRANNKQRRQIWKCQHILGKKRTDELISHHAKTASNWTKIRHILEQAIVDTALHRDNGTVVPLSANAKTDFHTTPSTDNLARESITDTLQTTWAHVDRMLQIHMRSDYERLLADHQLVDHVSAPNEMFTVTVKQKRAEQELHAKWYRFVKRYISDAIGREVDVRFIARQDWQVQNE